MTIIFEHAGKELEVSLPAHPSEVTYSAFVDFCAPVERYVEAEIAALRKAEKMEAEAPPGESAEAQPDNRPAVEWSPDLPHVDPDAEPPKQDLRQAEALQSISKFQYFTHLLNERAYNAKPEVLDVLLKSVRALASGEISLLPLYVEGDDLPALCEHGGALQPGGEASVTRLFAFLVYTFVNYQISPRQLPTNFSCFYKGETYFIEPDRANRLLLRKGYTVEEVFELQETERQLSGAITKHGDPDGVLQFTQDLMLIAVLLRREGERLPENHVERRRWVQERGRHFEALPMSVVLEVRFFLFRTLLNFQASEICRLGLATGSSSRTSPSPALAAGNTRTGRNGTLRKWAG